MVNIKRETEKKDTKKTKSKEKIYFSRIWSLI